MDTKENRDEVRNMIHDVLSGWEAATVAREELININLEGIKEHLARLNGSVARHEAIINNNLPHTVANCPQSEVINNLNDYITGDRAVKTERREGLRSSLQTIATIIMILGLCVTIFINKKDKIAVEKRIDNLGTPVQYNTRNGEVVNDPNIVIKYFPNDFTGDTTNNKK